MKTLTKNFTKRSLSVLLVLMMVFSLLTVGLTSASAAKVELAETGATFDGGSKIYLKPNGNWKADNAWFAAYFFNSTTNNIWAKMSVNAEQNDLYEATVPSGSWNNVIFCRMNANDTSTLSFDNVWNQTNDLVCAGKDLYTVDEGVWSNGTGSWSTYISNGTGEETGANTATIFVKLNGNTKFSAASNLYVWEASTKIAIGQGWPGVQLEGPNADGYYYRTFNYDASYSFIVNNGSGTDQTADSDAFTASKLLVTLDSGSVLTYKTEVLDDGGSGGTTEGKALWADIDGDMTTTGEIDRVYIEAHKTYANTYMLYLPASVDGSKLKLCVSEGTSVTVDGTAVLTTGTEFDASAIIPDAAGKYTLAGDFSGSLYVRQSSSVPSMHTTTAISVPQGTYQGYDHKDKFETNGNISFINTDGSKILDDAVLKKIKGRGNSSWEASHKIIGKYAFNITLDAKAKLLDESAKSKKYCLVSYNADEARMRNMIVYELAQQIGVNFAPDYEPVDLYNNGYYVGSYLLTDKVEIGDPLVDIVELDGINEEWSDNNTALYDDDSLMTRSSSGGSGINDNSTPGFHKYISNLDEPNASEYADSGFLLEFELNERFADEISGFISTKGQQIVCKYPEFATKNEIEFIMNKWNAAEAIMYNESATYEQLDAVIDVESFAKMYLIQELTKNLDGGATSYYVYYDGGKLHAGVAWDYDWTLGQYAKTYTNRVNSGSDFYDQVNADPSAYGGWYLNSKEIYVKGESAKTNVLNAQAALCQNDAFWSVVTAEWNEIFYSEATKFTDSTVSSVSELDLIIDQFYEKVKMTTFIDEAKWGLIASDPFITYNWGSTDTGDNHDAAVVWLNNWMYNRLEWMNKYIGTTGTSHTDIYNVDYIIQPPTLKADKELYQVGDTATITIDDKTDGDFTYTIYKDGVEETTTTDKTFTVTAGNKGIANYTVVATSNNSGKTSALSNAAKVEVEGFKFEADASAPRSVVLGGTIAFEANTNSPETVTFYLYDSSTGEKVLVDSNETGRFEVPATQVGSFYYTIEMETTVDGETYFDAFDFVVDVESFTLSVTLDGKTDVEAGQSISLKANAQSSSTVSYTFYDENNNIIAENLNGLYTKETTQDDVGKTFKYYVVAKTTVLGVDYTATSEVKTVTITAVKETYDVTVYFKSTSTLGYKPLITTSGAVDDLADKEMTKGIFISKNATQTASYYWYKADVQVSKANPSLSVSVLSSRYAMEGDINLTITESGDIYLAVDDLNAGYEMVNLTDWDENKRNWCQSAVHMIYDDSLKLEEDELEVLCANYAMRYFGDANGDGDVNIKDATLIQKSLASLATLDSTATEVSDLNSDGAVTIKDATAIQKQLAGL